MDAEIKGLLKAGVIEPCNVQSKWNSQIFLVQKGIEQNDYRFVCDMRSINSEYLPDSYELTNINQGNRIATLCFKFNSNSALFFSIKPCHSLVQGMEQINIKQ